MKSEILSIFEDMEMFIKNLNKTRYDTNFQTFYEKHNVFFSSLLSAIENSDNKEEVSNDISMRFIEAVRSTYGNKKGVIKSYFLADINMFMVQYIFPSIMKVESEYSLLLVESLRENWSATFKGSNLQHTTFETIFSGFKNKFLGITLDD